MLYFYPLFPSIICVRKENIIFKWEDLWKQEMLSIINYQHAETQYQKKQKQQKNLIIVSAIPQHLYLLTTK